MFMFCNMTVSSAIRLGTWLSTGNCLIAESLLSLGCFNWIALDNEHSSFTSNEILNITQIASARDIDVVVRVEEPNPFKIRKLLDMGVWGIMLPNVRNTEQISHLEEHLFFPPRGRRGFGLVRQNEWGDKISAQKTLEPFMIAQIESLEGAANAESIASLSFISSLFIGPYDLSCSAGEVGNFTSEKFLSAVKQIETQSLMKGKVLGIHTQSDLNTLEKAIDKKYSLLSYSYDIASLRASYAGVREWAKNRQ